MIRVNFFIKSLNLSDYNNLLPSYWIRCLQLLKYFKDFNDLKVSVNNFKYVPDILVIMRGFGEFEQLIARFYKLLGVKVVWDTCVNYFETDNKSTQVSIEQVNSTHKMIKYCDAVFASSNFIKNVASKYIKSYYLTDSINKEHFCYWKQRLNLSNPVIGWSGSSTKAEILNKHSNFLSNYRVNVITDKDPNLNFKYNFVEWDYKLFPEHIDACDIMFSPRDTNDLYNKGHSVFKVAVFLAQGIPVIADPIPSYGELNCPHLYLLNTRENDLVQVIRNIDVNRREWDEDFNSENIVKKYYDVFREVLNC